MFKYIVNGFEEMMDSIEKGFNEAMNVSYPEVERNELELITEYYMGVRLNIRPETESEETRTLSFFYSRIECTREFFRLLYGRRCLPKNERRFLR